jgi:hypothetical protein
MPRASSSAARWMQPAVRSPVTPPACNRSPGICSPTRSSSRPGAAESPSRGERRTRRVQPPTARPGHRSGDQPGVPAPGLRALSTGRCCSYARARRPRPGLAIVHHLVELHGGSITAHSAARTAVLPSPSRCRCRIVPVVCSRVRSRGYRGSPSTMIHAVIPGIFTGAFETTR